MDFATDLAEVLHIVHFKAPLFITALEFADFVSNFRADFPGYQETPATALVSMDGTVPPDFPSLDGFPIWPRAVLRSADGQEVVTFQIDRLAFGWERTRPLGEAVPYPGYGTISAKFLEVISKFQQWYSSNRSEMIESRLVEIVYNNAFIISQGGHQVRTTSDILRFIKPMGVMVNQFQMGWARHFTDHQSPGRVNVQAVVRTAPPDLVVLALTLSGLGQVDGPITGAQVLEVLNRLHGEVLDMHAATII